MGDELKLWQESGHPVIYINGSPLDRLFFFVEDAFSYMRKIFPDITDSELRDLENGETFRTPYDTYEIK